MKVIDIGGLNCFISPHLILRQPSKFGLNLKKLPVFRGQNILYLSIRWVLNECSCSIEFIKRVWVKRSNARLAEHFISFSQQV